MEGLTFDVGLNQDSFNSGIGSMQSSLNNLGATANKVGGIIIAALGGAAIVSAISSGVKAFNDYDKSLANIGTLIGGNEEVMQKYSNTIQRLSVDTGTSTQVLSEGTYQVISAFGDIPEAMEILEVGAKGAVAGVANTTDAINLLSATMKGYNMELTGESAQAVSDYAFTAVRLGQTTFPELASSMGRVIPIANALNISQEELWGTMATFTGVTGNTSEVVTQLRGVMAGLASPTKVMAGVLSGVADQLVEEGQLQGDIADKYKATSEELYTMTDAYDALVAKKEAGATLTEEENKQLKIMKTDIKSLTEQLTEYQGGLSSAIIASIGFPELLTRIGDAAQGNTGMLKEMFGRIEATTLALAAGELKDTWLEKIEAMYESAGASAEAYMVHAESIYHSFEQLKSAAEVAKISVGGLFATMLQPLVQDITLNIAGFASSMRQATQDFVEWREELQTKETFQEKLEFTLDAIVNVGKTLLQAAGEKIDSFADYLRTDVLGIPADSNTSFDIGDAAAIVNAGISVIKGVVTWFGKQVDNKADAIRAELGLSADDNEGTDIGDIKVIGKAVFDRFTNSASDFLALVKGKVDEIITGKEPVNLGELKVNAKGALDLIDVVWGSGKLMAAVAIGIQTIKGLAGFLTGTLISVPQILLTIGGIGLAIDFGTMLGNAIVEEMNKEDYLKKAFKLVEEQMGKQVLSPEEMAETGLWADVKNSFKIWYRIGVAELRKGLDEVIEEEKENMPDTQKELYEAIFNEPFEQEPSGAFGTESGFDKFVELIKMGIANKADEIIKQYEDSTAKIDTAIKNFMDSLQGDKTPTEVGEERAAYINDVVETSFDKSRFETWYQDTVQAIETAATETEAPVIKFEQSMQKLKKSIEPLEIGREGEETQTFMKGFMDGITEFIGFLTTSQTQMMEEFMGFSETYNTFVEEYNKTIAGTDLSPLPELVFEPPKLAEDFDAQMETVIADVNAKMDMFNYDEAGEKKYSIDLGFKLGEVPQDDMNLTGGTMTYTPYISPLSEERKKEIGQIIYKPVEDSSLDEFVSAIFDKAQIKIDNMKNVISNLFEGAGTKKSNLELQIENMESILSQYEDAVSQRFKKGIESSDLTQAISDITEKLNILKGEQHLVEIGVKVLDSGYEILSSFGLLINGVDRVITSVINAVVNGKSDVKEIKLSLEEVPTDPILPQVNVEVNGVQDIWNVQDELGLIPPVTPSEITAIDNASGTIREIQEMTIDPKTVSINFAKGSGFSGLRFGPDGTIIIDPSELGITETRATGGYTANVGRSTPAGIVHGGEWVAPAWMVEDSKFSRAIETLEKSRKTRSYANGGTVIPQQTFQPVINFTFHIDQFVGTEEEAGNRIGEIAYAKLKEQGHI